MIRLDKIDNEDILEYRKQATDRNIKIAHILLPIIIVFELGMTIFGLIRGKLYMPKRLAYFSSYIFLATISILSLFIIDLYNKCKISLKTINVCTYIYAIFILFWGVFISVLDSPNSYRNIVFLTIMVSTFYILSLNIYFSISIIAFSTITYCLAIFIAYGYFDFNQSINLLIFVLILFCILITQKNLSIKMFNALKYEKAHNIELKSINERLNSSNVVLEKSANIDILTGVNNRLSFNKKSQILYDYCLSSNTNLCYVMLDVDDFKKINDINGHQIGDACLVEMCNMINSLSTYDFFRVGGEEFMFVTYGKTSEILIAEFEEIRNKIEKNFFTQNKVKITISLGVYSAIPSKDISIDDFFSKVDMALYTAKNNGKNKIIDFDKV